MSLSPRAAVRFEGLGFNTVYDYVAGLVVDDQGILLGRLRQKALTKNPDALIADVIENGPTTIRPNTDLAEIIARMQAKKVDSIIITKANGRLIGLRYRQNGEEQLKNVIGK